MLNQFVWKTIFDYDLPTSMLHNNDMLLHLYYGYTETAITRFLRLESNTRTAVKQYFKNAFDIYKRTYLLLGIFTDSPHVLYSGARRHDRISSIRAMQRYHDLTTEELIREQRIKESCRYVWEGLNLVISKTSDEWYLPEFHSDIRLRGQTHHNCLGGYSDRHFADVSGKGRSKTLLLFTDFYEAEVSCAFTEVDHPQKGKRWLCTGAKVYQAKGACNANIPDADRRTVEKIAQSFVKLPVELFNAVKLPK